MLLERPRVVEKRGDDTVEPVHFFDDHFDELALFDRHGLRVEALRGPFDGAERVANFVGEAGGHFTQRGQAVAFTHFFVQLGVFDDGREMVSQFEHQGDFV